MTIYWVVYFAVLLLFIQEAKYTRITFVPLFQIHTRKFSFVIIFFALMSIGILRHEHLGTDTYSYLDHYFIPMFNKNFFQALMSDSDFGYALVNWFVTRFTKDYWIFRAIVFAVSFSSISVWIYKYSKIVSLSYLCFLSFGYLEMEFYLLRLSLAVSIFIWSYRPLIERKFVKYCTLVLIAAAFHKSALFMLIVYPLLSKRFRSLSRLMRIAFLAGAVVISRVGGYYITLFYKRKNYADEMNSNNGYRMLFFILVLLIVILLYEQRNNRLFRYRTRGLMLSMLYPQILATSVSIVSRILKYSETYLFILLPDVLRSNALRKTEKETFSVIITCILTAFYAYSILSGNKFDYYTHFTKVVHFS